MTALPEAVTAPRDLLQDHAYPALKSHIIEMTGLAYFAGKDAQIAEYIERRLAERGVSDCAGYLDLIKQGRQGAEELDQLIADLTVGETYFFRHVEQFNAICDIALPALIERNAASRRLRIWSAGCAIGAEPYTLAILLSRLLGARLQDWSIDILATDINRRFLAQAETARFGSWALRATPEDVKTHCFDAVGESWVLRRPYRDMVRFEYHNLVRDPWPGGAGGAAAFELVLCRNVMIYFDRDTVEQVLAQFHGALVEGGWLAVGHSDWNALAAARFRTVMAHGASLHCKDHIGERAPAAVYSTAGPAPIVAPVRPVAARGNPTAANDEGRPSTADDAVREQIRHLADDGCAAQAEALCLATLAASPLDPMVHFYLALLRTQSGDFQQAERLLRQAIYLDRGLALAHYHLALVLMRSGRRREAARCRRNVLNLLERAVSDDDRVMGGEMTVRRLRALALAELAAE